MSNQSGTGTVERLWTPKDLAERWRCSVDTAMDRVRTKGVPFLWLGPGEPRLTGRGPKFVRFRRQAIEQWEARHEGYWGPEVPQPKSEGHPKISGGLLRGQNARR